MLKVKGLLILSLLSPCCLCQVTVPILVPGEATTVPVTISSEAVSSLVAYAKNIPVGIPNGTLASAVTSTTQTTFVLNSAPSIQLGNGLLIGSEVSLVIAINGTSVTVVRAQMGTTAAIYSVGAPVSYIRNGSYSAMLGWFLRDQITQVMGQYPGPSTQTNNATITTAQAANMALLSAAVVF